MIASGLGSANVRASTARRALRIAKWESEVESGKWMAGVSDTQLSEGPRAMVKDISTSVRTGVCVCALSHTAVGAVSELSRLSSFPSRP